MMARRFIHDVTLEVLLCGNSFELVATVEFTATPIVPATYWQPAEGGEVEVLDVIDLFMVKPADTQGVKLPADAIVARPIKESVDCPNWLRDLIIAALDEDALFQSADFDDDDREYDYDPRD